MAMWTGLGDNTELFWAVLAQEATRFVGSGISYREDNPIQDFSSLFK
jgi:hypothetical protein